MEIRKCQLVLLLLLGALLLAACATVEAPGKATEQPEAITLGRGTTDGSCGTTLCCSNCPAIPMLRVIDGDTFTTSGNQSVRLFGVDTPERGEKCYQEATDRLRELAGGEVRVELGPRSKDRYGRLLYYAYTEAGDSIDEILVSEGLAKAWTRDGQHRDLLVGLEQGGVGCLRSQTPLDGTQTECDPAYPSVCIPPPPPDLDCGEIPHRRFTVLAPDPHGFDRDKDGIGCESG